jgi:integrase
MKTTVQKINELVNRVRSGEPPELPEGKREKCYHDPILPGLYIRVLNTGVATWVVQWKRLGRQKKKALGDVKVLNREEAITAARKLLAKITLETLDPHEARRERMRAAKVTFATLVPLFLADKRRDGVVPGTDARWTLYFTGYYFKPLHNLPIDEITREQIQTQIDIIANRSGKRTAGAAYTGIRLLFKCAFETDKLPGDHHNPMINVRSPPEGKPRERVLDDAEIRVIWKTCEDWEATAIFEKEYKEKTGKPLRGGNPVSADYPRAIKLLFLLGCRAQEIGSLQWSEVDLDNREMRIPGTRTKNKRDLCIPLCNMAVEILRSIEKRPGNNQVFGRGRRKVLGLGLSGADSNIDKLIAKGGITKSTVQNSLAPAGIVQSIAQVGINRRITEVGNTPPPDWTIHDIRRTFRTRLAALGVSMDVAEALLGHVGHRNRLVRTYDLHERWSEKRQALAMWEANLRAILDGTAKKIDAPRFGERKKGVTA